MWESCIVVLGTLFFIFRIKVFSFLFVTVVVKFALFVIEN